MFPQLDDTATNWDEANTWRERALKAEERLALFEKYIHVCACSDEGGYFAFFTPSGEIDDLPDWRINGCQTEEEAVQRLCEQAYSTFTEKGWVD